VFGETTAGDVFRNVVIILWDLSGGGTTFWGLIKTKGKISNILIIQMSKIWRSELTQLQEAWVRFLFWRSRAS
jgi:hypothetical protein